jgi:hypothetical protein
MPIMPIDRPKCIVLPLQMSPADGVGLALHFLLGNVIAVHTGFAECWFGWRVAKIFETSAGLRAYCRAQSPDLDLPQVSATQKICCWVHGRMRRNRVALGLYDSRTQQNLSEEVAFSVMDDLMGFRNGFLRFLDRCGVPMAPERHPLALWPEKITETGLRLFGTALETFYIYSAYGGQGSIDLKPFMDAAHYAPDSFMAHNLLGWACYRNENAVDARDSFLKALDLNPYAAGTMSGLMWCAVLQKDKDAAGYWAGRKAETLNKDVQAAVQKVLERI